MGIWWVALWEILSKLIVASEIDFRQRCREKLEKLVDVALSSQNYSEATEHFSTMLLLDPVDHIGILIRRSEARMSMNQWKEALGDADEVSFVPLVASDNI